MSSVDPTGANTGILHPSFLVLFFNEDASYLLSTDPSWCQPPAYSAAAATTPPAPMPTRAHHWESKHPGCPVVRAGAVHLGSGEQGFWRDAAD